MEKVKADNNNIIIYFILKNFHSKICIGLKMKLLTLSKIQETSLLNLTQDNVDSIL